MKGIITYYLTVAVEPTTKLSQFKHKHEIILRETRKLQRVKFQTRVTCCCCVSIGITVCSVHFEKDGYTPGELVEMVMEIDNSNCKADIPTIKIGINSTISMRIKQ